MPNRPADPCIFVLFGATGDLTRRKLIPALYNLQRDKLLPENFAVCAYARKQKTDDEFRADLIDELRAHSRRPPQDDWESLASRIFYVSGEFDDDAGYARLKARLEELDRQLGTRGCRLFYFAVASEFFVELAGKLARNGLLVREGFPETQPAEPNRDQPWMRVILEKPIGRDLNSARRMLRQIGEFAAESQVYRIDHYLGKETVQNILALRFGNCIFEPIWNRGYINHVQITVAEKEGVGTRAGYYDTAGALRDVAQNHVLQLLCMVAMESPGSMRADDIRNEKVKILHNLRPMSPQGIAADTVRGQYGPSADGKQTGYRQERGVNPQSTTETFAAVRCFVDTWRWAGVPFLLRTGKCMPRRETEISVHFRVPPLQLFDETPASASCVGDVLRIRVQPDEGIRIDFAAKIPGAGMRLKTVPMDFDYARAFNTQTPEAYERLLLDAMSGDATLFTRNDEVEAQWKFITTILDGWAALPPPNFPNYDAGMWGPFEAVRLVPACAQGWAVGD